MGAGGRKGVAQFAFHLDQFHLGRGTARLAFIGDGKTFLDGGDQGGAVFIRGMGTSRPGSEIKTYVDGVPFYMPVWNTGYS
mgnify:CR=1 FL=1